MRRKTVNLAEVVERVNRQNRDSTCESKVREGWNALLESLLMDANVYAGFQNLKHDKVPDGQLPGVIWEHGKGTYPNGLVDDTRRVYYVHKSLKRKNLTRG